MLSNKTIEVIRSQMKIMLALINGETEGAEKARKDIISALSEFNDFVNEIEDEQREFEENFNSYIEQ